MFGKPPRIILNVHEQNIAGDTLPPLTPSNGSSKRNKFIIIFIIGIAILLGIVVLGSVLTIHKLQSKINTKKTNANTVTCSAPTASTVTTATARSVYKIFVQAVKSANQSCADALSSEYFIKLQNKAFPHSNGKWITDREGGLPSVRDRLSQLPEILTDENFSQTLYTRSLSQLKGLTLSYPLNDANNIRYNLNISFVTENNVLIVDKLELKPIF